MANAESFLTAGAGLINSNKATQAIKNGVDFGLSAMGLAGGGCEYNGRSWKGGLGERDEHCREETAHIVRLFGSDSNSFGLPVQSRSCFSSPVRLCALDIVPRHWHCCVAHH
jgi:hypothetical protein